MRSQKESELALKIILVGDNSVGKTSLIECIKNGPNNLAKTMTTGRLFNFLVNYNRS